MADVRAKVPELRSVSSAAAQAGEDPLRVIVFRYIDRMNDVAPECGDPAERILDEFAAEVNAVLKAERANDRAAPTKPANPPSAACCDRCAELKELKTRAYREITQYGRLTERLLPAVSVAPARSSSSAVADPMPKVMEALRFYANQLSWPNNAWHQPMIVDASALDNHRPDGPQKPSDMLLHDRGSAARQALAALEEIGPGQERASDPAWNPYVGQEVRLAEHLARNWPEWREQRLWIVGINKERRGGQYPIDGLNITVSEEWPITSQTSGFTDAFYVGRREAPDDLAPVVPR